jgi:hypothetical protein
MAQRLNWIKATPASWLDWSPLRGGAAADQLVPDVVQKIQAIIAFIAFK